jgi:transposase InsO family protein
MSEYLNKSHKVSVLLYHIVCPAKYRRVVIREEVDKTLKSELVTLDGKHTDREVRQSVFMYVEAYYNRLRLHSALDYVAPDRFNYGQPA